MTTSKKEQVVFGAGPIIKSNEVILTGAFAEQDLETLKVQMEFWANLSKTVASYRQTACKLYDLATSGYVNADWLKDTERLVKKDPDKPRGRKPGEKVDPSTNC
jgi:hypothetical protein